MNYKDIKDFKQRCKEQPVGYPAQMQAHLHEEIAELRNYIEWYLTPERNFCTRCGKNSLPCIHSR